MQIRARWFDEDVDIETAYESTGLTAADVMRSFIAGRRGRWGTCGGGWLFWVECA